MAWMDRCRRKGFPSKRMIALALVGCACGFNCNENTSTVTVPSGEFTVRVSVDQSGGQANGSSQSLSVSSDGRFVAFSSTAPNLVPGAVDGFIDIFVKDRQTGVVENVTFVQSRLNSVFGPFPSDCVNPSISANGRFVVFETMGMPAPVAPNPFDPEIPRGPTGVQTTKNLYVRDRVTGVLARVVDDTNNGAWPNQDCVDGSVTPDGKYVVFATSATNLTDALGGALVGTGSQIYVADFTLANPPVVPPTLRLLSVKNGATTAFQACNGICTSPKLSADGQYVVFESTATNLTGDPGVSNSSIFRAALDGSSMELVSREPGVAGLPSNNGDCHLPNISSDGRFITYWTFCGNIVPGEGGWGAAQFRYFVAMRDMQTATNSVVVPSITINQPFLPSSIGILASVSSDGRFATYTDALVPSSTASQIHFKDLLNGADRLVSVYQLSGATAEGDCVSPVMTPDALWIFWQSQAGNLVFGDSNGAMDIFAHGPLSH